MNETARYGQPLQDGPIGRQVRQARWALLGCAAPGLLD